MNYWYFGIVIVFAIAKDYVWQLNFGGGRYIWPVTPGLNTLEQQLLLWQRVCGLLMARIPLGYIRAIFYKIWYNMIVKSSLVEYKSARSWVFIITFLSTHFIRFIYEFGGLSLSLDIMHCQVTEKIEMGTWEYSSLTVA